MQVFGEKEWSFHEIKPKLEMNYLQQPFQKV